MYSQEELAELEKLFPLGSKVRVAETIREGHLAGEMFVQPMYSFLGEECEIVDWFISSDNGRYVFQLILRDPALDDRAETEEEQYIFLLDWIDDPRIKDFQKREREIQSKHFANRARLTKMFKKGMPVKVKTDTANAFDHRWPYSDPDEETEDTRMELDPGGFTVSGIIWPDEIYSENDFALSLNHKDDDEYYHQFHLEEVDDPRLNQMLDPNQEEASNEGFVGLALAGLAAGIVGAMSAKQKHKEVEVISTQEVRK